MGRPRCQNDFTRSRLVTPQQPDEKRRTDRIVVDVGGTRFATSASTLTSASEYFERLLSPRWCAEPPEELKTATTARNQGIQRQTLWAQTIGGEGGGL